MNIIEHFQSDERNKELLKSFGEYLLFSRCIGPLRGKDAPSTEVTEDDIQDWINFTNSKMQHLDYRERMKE